jgi:hypothetical protein
MNARALPFLLMLAACSTTSSKAPAPELVHAQCPPAKVTLDRSFAAQPPPCVSQFAAPELDGDSWGSVAAGLGKEVRDRQTCLTQVASWIESERKARLGAPTT